MTNKISYKKLFTFISLGLVSQCILAQEIGQYNPISFPSPNASSLGEFGKIPVSLFTGTPNISIPLYEVKEGNINVPIALSYHGSGIRVDEQPSWVGLGWTLQVGGAITRMVNGLPDEASVDYVAPGGTTSFNNKCGYYYTHSLLSAANWYDYSNETSANVGLDKEPDEFNFNFNGINGSFYLDHNGNWVVKSDLSIKVVFDESQDFSSYLVPLLRNQMFYRFKLITPDGTTYVFGGNMASIEFTRPQGKSNVVPTATTWNLTKIIDSNGNEVNFGYIRGNLIPQMSYLEMYSSSDASSNYTVWLSFTGLISIPVSMPYSCGSTSFQRKLSCVLIEPSYLESITTKNQIVMFYSCTANDLQLDGNLFNGTGISFPYDDIVIKNMIDYNLDPYAYINNLDPYHPYRFGFVAPDLSYNKRKKLNDIVVFPNDNSITIPTNKYTSQCLKYDFSNDIKIIDFQYAETSTKRLSLNGISVSSSTSTQSANYSFGYFDDPDIELPGYVSLQMDHWGYYNGRTATLVGQDFNDYYQQREPNTDVKYQLEGMLKTITYPTGGYTEIEYEPHNYSCVFKRVPVGITASSPYGIAYVDIDETGVNNTSSGLRVKKVKSYSEATATPITHTYYYEKNYSTSSAISSGYLTNKPVYFWGANLGSQDLSNFKGGFSFFMNSSLLPLSVSGSHIGYSEVVDVEESNGYTINKYTMPKKTDPTNPTTEDYQDFPPKDYTGNSYFKPLNSLSLERGKLLSMEVFDNNNVEIKSTTYKYNSDPNRFSNCVRSRNLDALYVCSNQGILYTGTARYIYTYPFYVEEETNTNYVNGVAAQAITTSYKYNDVKLVKEITQTQSNGSTLTTKYNYPVDYPSQSVLCPKPDDAMTTALEKMKDNNILNLPVEIISLKNMKVTSTELNMYSYDWSNGLLSKAKVMKLKTNAPIGAEDPFVSSYVNRESKWYGWCNKTFNYDQRYEDNILFDKYDSRNNLLQYHKTNDVNASYLWGYNQTLPIAKIVNASADQVAYTSFESWQDLGEWSCTGTILSNSKARTGNTYMQINGAGSITKSVIAGNYFVEYWAKSPVSISGGTVAEFSPSVPDANGWILYRKKVVLSSTSTIAISGSTDIDELRLFPINSQVTTYTYDPLIGMTSTTDPNGVTTYYEYDTFGRLKLIKDDEGNILKKYEYNYQK